MIFRVMAAAGNDRGPVFMEQVLSALHQGTGPSDPVTLSFVRRGPTVGLTCAVPDKHAAFFFSQLLAHYPAARLERVREEQQHTRENLCTIAVDVTLHPQLFPIKRFPQFEDRATEATTDPLTGILSALAGHEHDPLRPRVDLTIQPVDGRRVRRSRRTLRNLARPRFHANKSFANRYIAHSLSRHWHRHCRAWFMKWRAGPLADARGTATPASRAHDRENALQAADDKLSRRLFDVQLRLSVQAPVAHEARARAKVEELAGALGPLAIPQLATWHIAPPKKFYTVPPRLGEAFLLSAEELATLWHLPTLSIQSPTLEVTPWRQLEPEPLLPDPRSEPETLILGRTAFRDRRSLFGVRADDRRRHLYIAGKTGMGKSSLLQNLITNDIHADRGCCLIDPHGDLAEAVLAGVPPRRTNDVVLFDTGDQGYPIAFNPLADCEPQARPLVASGMLTAFKKLYGESWGPRLEHIFRNCLLALLEIPEASLVSLVQLLGDAEYRTHIVGRVTDPVVRSFWLREFAGMPAKLQAEAIAPIQNKVGQFVSSPLLRHILGQARSTIDLRRIMDRGQVLIVNQIGRAHV